MPEDKLSDLLAPLTTRHQSALLWFMRNAGSDILWADLPKGDDRVATAAKGIYKPAWSSYALSARQTLFNSPYKDWDPVYRHDGSWTYLYHQEDAKSGNHDTLFTNVGLMQCRADRVPVGVIRQVSADPALYRVLGVALVTGRDGGYFILEGFSPDGEVHTSGSQGEIEVIISSEETADAASGLFSSESMEDGRERTLSAIVLRRGQPAFRRLLLKAYAGKCAITGCDAPAALEAAHIVPYLGPETDHVTNGLLLRADIHTLFDLGLLAVNPSTMTVVVARDIEGTTYGELAGRRLSLPPSQSDWPSRAHLEHRLAWSGL